MDFSKHNLATLHAMVKVVKQAYMSTISKLTREECIFILERLPLPTKDKVEILKKHKPTTKPTDDEDYDF